ncbi:MAG TPA: heavy metal sensor histidine kinase [Noviherbaspirillum sp.]|uniref:heavy metal sensor histidine kinase n=1 Tax=Noviherbaspirillum sp. TaxID=1926288 RepID=UPI002B491011|nr:heavy metal sensor histidine kinase [Noviherbaspirillum sp.]HJV85337.1 heavy metal sensor histidine kinase [Noviherbaspirillum sp.]
MQLMKRMSLTFRLTMLFACASTAVLLALGLLVGRLVERHFEELDMEVLKGKMELARDALRIARSPADLDMFSQHLDDALTGHAPISLAIRRADGRHVVAVGHAEFPDAMLRPATANSMAGAVWTNSEGKTFRGISGLAQVQIKDWSPAVIGVAIDMSPHEHFMASFQRAFWSVVVLAAIINGLLGWGAVRRELAPVRTIRQRASEITASHLDQRLDVESVPPELVELVQTLNAMLGRLEESFQRLSDFSSDLAHELRTPVSNMLTQTQVILSRVRSADEYREILYSNAEEFERLSRMMSDMLFLAKADHGLVSPFKEEVDIAAEVRDLFSFFEVVAEGRDIRLAITGEGNVTGDRALLRRAISNVVSNAIRHTRESGMVRASIKVPPEKNELVLCIENTGDPIPPEHIPRLFDRFYRADSSRQGSSEGAGLGLAIARSILALHRGTVNVHCADGLTCFEMHLPCRAPALRSLEAKLA